MCQNFEQHFSGSRDFVRNVNFGLQKLLYLLQFLDFVPMSAVPSCFFRKSLIPLPSDNFCCPYCLTCSFPLCPLSISLPWLCVCSFGLFWWSWEYCRSLHLFGPLFRLSAGPREIFSPHLLQSIAFSYKSYSDLNMLLHLSFTQCLLALIVISAKCLLIVEANP